MMVTKKLLALFDRVRPLLEVLPEETSVELHFAGADLAIQAKNQAAVRAIRAVFPGVTVWVKQYDAALRWWEYTTSWQGLRVLVYACREAPPTCRAIEESYDTEERVPVAWEMQRVTKTRVRWDCSGAPEAA